MELHEQPKEENMEMCCLCEGLFPEDEINDVGSEKVCDVCFLDNCFECEVCGIDYFNGNNWGDEQINLCESCANAEPFGEYRIRHGGGDGMKKWIGMIKSNI